MGCLGAVTAQRLAAIVRNSLGEHMEDLGEGLFKSILRIIGLFFRGLLWVLINSWDLCLERPGWYIGWPVCRLLSLGRLPKEAWGEPDRASDKCQALVAIIGLIAIFIVVVGISSLLGASALN